MAESQNGQGRPRRKPGAPPRQLSNPPLLFCIFCCQLMKKGDQPNIMPAITMVPIAIPHTGMWVAVPTCMGHLEVPEVSSLIH